MEKLPKKIMDSVQEIFSTMVMMEVVPGEPILGAINPLQSTITGMIGLAGTYRGTMAIHLPHELAMKVTGNFLGMEVTEIDDDVHDAIGELANMLGGSIKALLSDNGKDIKLSMPSTICGQEYRFHSHDGGESVVLPFTTNESQFLVELRFIQEE